MYTLFNAENKILNFIQVKFWWKSGKVDKEQTYGQFSRKVSQLRHFNSTRLPQLRVGKVFKENKPFVRELHALSWRIGRLVVMQTKTSKTKTYPCQATPGKVVTSWLYPGYIYPGYTLVIPGCSQGMARIRHTFQAWPDQDMLSILQCNLLMMSVY